jgi:hypothetical protein
LALPPKKSIEPLLVSVGPAMDRVLPSEISRVLPAPTLRLLMAALAFSVTVDMPSTI